MAPKSSITAKAVRNTFKEVGTLGYLKGIRYQ